MAKTQKTPTPKPAKTPKPATQAADSARQPEAEVVTSTPSTISSTPTPGEPAGGTKHMELNLKHKPNARASERLVIFDYTDRKGSVQFLRTLFGESIPEQITISGAFTPPPAPKEKETPEQRKARLAARPKPTEAEKLAKLEERAAKLREKLASNGADTDASEGAGAPA